MAKLFPIDQDVRARVEFWNFDAEFYEISWTEINTTRVHIEAFQPPWATVQMAERSLDPETIIDVPWRVPKPNVSDLEQTAEVGISVSPEGIPFQVTVDSAMVEPLQLTSLEHDVAKAPTCLVTYKRGRKAKIPSMVEPIETPTKAEPTSVPAVARAMAAMAAVAVAELVVVPPPQPYEQLLAIQRQIGLLQQKDQAFRPRDFSKNIESMREHRINKI